MAYYTSGFCPVSPGKILCNAGDRCAAFTKPKDEKSVPAKLELKTSCIREQTCHCTWTYQEQKVVHVLLSFYRSGVCNRLRPAASNFRSIRWCETISVRRLWQAECPATLGLSASFQMFVTDRILIHKIWSVQICAMSFSLKTCPFSPKSENSDAEILLVIDLLTKVFLFALSLQIPEENAICLFRRGLEPFTWLISFKLL